MIKNYLINIFVFYFNLINNIILIYDFLSNKYIFYNLIEPNKKTWKSHGYIDNKNNYLDFYNDNIIYYENKWSIYVQKLENGFYLYNNKLAINRETQLFEKSCINFLLITLIQNNNKYNIFLKTNEYIIGNNILSKIFIYRYLKYNYFNNFKYFNIKLPYKITIFDNNINIIEINENQSILLNKNDYLIIHSCNS